MIELVVPSTHIVSMSLWEAFGPPLLVGLAASIVGVVGGWLINRLPVR